MIFVTYSILQYYYAEKMVNMKKLSDYANIEFTLNLIPPILEATFSLILSASAFYLT